MKRTLSNTGLRAQVPPVGKPRKQAEQCSTANVQQYLPDKLRIGPKDFNRHLAKISWVKNSFDYSTKRKWSSHDLLTQGFERGDRGEMELSSENHGLPGQDRGLGCKRETYSRFTITAASPLSLCVMRFINTDLHKPNGYNFFFFYNLNITVTAEERCFCTERHTGQCFQDTETQLMQT